MNFELNPAHVSAARNLLEQMTLEEKLAQIVGFWDKGDGEAVAPLQGEFAAASNLTAVSVHGLGHLTRVYGTRPVDPIAQAQWLWSQQRRVVQSTRLGIPMLVHEECLTGLSAWTAATFPTPLAWGAARNPELVYEMAALIGKSMAELGIHQGLSPVLDVIRDPRWGRVEECLGEDPYLVATLGTEYVKGLQSKGVHATLKHFVGYSASQSGRNFGPVHAGPREIADVLLPPFEMAILDGNVRSVMHAYNEIDGVPVAANAEYLTDLLRGQWGFRGTVVADYFGVAFLEKLHGIASSPGQAAGLALEAGVDIELPTGDAYLKPLAAAVRAGDVDEALVDRAVQRALEQKAALGLLGNRFEHEPPTQIDLDSPEHRRVARELAEQSIVLLSNDGTLPLPREPQPGEAKQRRPYKIAVVGPNADRVSAMMGCYSFVNHVIALHEGVEMGIEVPTVLEAIRSEFLDSEVQYALGCAVNDQDRRGFAEAADLVTDSDLTVLVLGDQAGLFGRGTVGEGCDRDDLELPGVQRELAEHLLTLGKPVVIIAITGRPYVMDWALQGASAVLQSFFPGEEGGPALAAILSGRVNPSAKLPVSLPRSTGAQPFTYLHPPLGGDSGVTNLSTKPGRPFGFGLSYTSFDHGELRVESGQTNEGVSIELTVTNSGTRRGTEVVQLFARDLVGTITRPVAELVGYNRVTLEPGESKVLSFNVPPARLSFTNRQMKRVVEPGEFLFWTGHAESHAEHTADSGITNTATANTVTADTGPANTVTVVLTGDVHYVKLNDQRQTQNQILETSPKKHLSGAGTK